MFTHPHSAKVSEYLIHFRLPWMRLLSNVTVCMLLPWNHTPVNIVPATHTINTSTQAKFYDGPTFFSRLPVFWPPMEFTQRDPNSLLWRMLSMSAIADSVIWAYDISVKSASQWHEMLRSMRWSLQWLNKQYSWPGLLRHNPIIWVMSQCP